MALLTDRAYVNYGEQQGARMPVACHSPDANQVWRAADKFEEFLRDFKSSSSEAAERLGGLRLTGDGLADDYDLMDESDDPVADGADARRGPKHKYMDMLQDVADRVQSTIVIDLDDVDAVSEGIALRLILTGSGLQFEKKLGVEKIFRLAESIEQNTHHYLEVLSRAVDKVMPEPSSEPT